MAGLVWPTIKMNNTYFPKYVFEKIARNCTLNLLTRLSIKTLEKY